MLVAISSFSTVVVSTILNSKITKWPLQCAIQYSNYLVIMFFASSVYIMSNM